MGKQCTFRTNCCSPILFMFIAISSLHPPPAAKRVFFQSIRLYKVIQLFSCVIAFFPYYWREWKYCSDE